MEYEHLIVEREGAVAVVTINRHERRNTLAASRRASSFSRSFVSIVFMPQWAANLTR